MAGAYSRRGEETRENESATTHQIVEIYMTCFCVNNNTCRASKQTHGNTLPHATYVTTILTAFASFVVYLAAFFPTVCEPSLSGRRI